MIVGETIRLQHVETQYDPVTGESTAFVATGASALLTAPDGTTQNAVVNVANASASDPESRALVFSFLVTPALGGAYKCALSYSDRGGETITRILTAFATWTDPSQLVENRLQMSLTPGVFEPEFASAARKLLAQFVCLGNPPGSSASVGLYSGLTGDDQAFFDEAATLIALTRIAGPLRTAGELSDLVGKKIDTYGFTFADGARDALAQRGSPGDYGAGPGGYSGTNERVRWLREAAEALGKVSCIRQYFQAQRAAFSPFALAGLTRTQKRSSEAAGGGRTLLGQVVDLFTSDYYVEQDYAVGPPGGW